jgi:hypothetical protein
MLRNFIVFSPFSLSSESQCEPVKRPARKASPY